MHGSSAVESAKRKHVTYESNEDGNDQQRKNSAKKLKSDSSNVEAVMKAAALSESIKMKLNNIKGFASLSTAPSAGKATSEASEATAATAADNPQRPAGLAEALAKASALKASLLAANNQQKQPSIATVNTSAPVQTSVKMEPGITVKAESLSDDRLFAAAGDANKSTEKVHFQPSSVHSQIAAIKAEHHLPTRKTISYSDEKALTDSYVMAAVSSGFVDHSLHPSKADRKPRQLKLIEPGTHIRQADRLRMDQMAFELKPSAYSDDAVNQTPLAILNEDNDNLPEVEWWDAVILKNAATEKYNSKINESKITSHIYHPVELTPKEPPPPPPQPVPLTLKERRKITKRLRRDKIKEQQDRIRTGLDPPPEPKLRLRNLTNSLFLQSVADPSALEAKIRKEVAERVRKHEAENEARKLTKEQKAEKQRRKYADEPSRGLFAAVFKVAILSHPQARFKVGKNAQQLNITGCAITLDGSFNVVIVEGVQRAIRRYTNLMLRRIKWASYDVKSDEAETLMSNAPASVIKLESHMIPNNNMNTARDDELHSDDSEAEEHIAGAMSNDDYCELIWTGGINARSFERFRFEDVHSEMGARKVLEKHGVEHYWQLARSQPVTQTFI